MNQSRFQAILCGLFDESILVREARRWRHQQRWKLLAMAVLVCGAVAGLLFGPLLYDWRHGGQSLDFPRGMFALLMASLTLLGLLLAFYQSMQALRKELSTQTLEGLFLTLQTDRGVILSVVGAGIIAGGILQLIFLPFVLLTAIALSMNALQVIVALSLLFASIVAGAALGALWFFVSQQLFAVNTGFGRTVLNLIGLAAFGGAAAYLTGFWRVPDTMAVGSVWVCIFYGLAGMMVWSLRTVIREARDAASSRDDGSPGKLVGRAVVIAAAALMGLLLLSIGVILPQASSAGLGFTMPASYLGFLFPPAAMADLLISSHTVISQWAGILLAFNGGLTAALLLV
ncbi:MAG TPA: hypothetical protein VFJ58_10175, partial [Armatimonadota bacterium]|nr:hypothetical protein [Armatimonadota bacterium]